MQIKNALTIFALMLVQACGMIPVVTETEKALCRAWGDSLSTRSRLDTVGTQEEIGEGYGDFKAQCPKETWPEWLS